jgi:hypothetical protein
MPEHTDSLDARRLIEWLLGSDSRDEMHAVIQSWLRANPASPSLDAILARVDAALEGWYRAEYDPREVSPALAELVATAERLGRDRDAARGWVADWAHEPHEGLGGQAPVRVLHTAEGLDLVRDLLIRAIERQ